MPNIFSNLSPLQSFPVKLVLSLGYGGGMVRELRSGDLIIVREISLGNYQDGEGILKSSGNLVELAVRAMKNYGSPIFLGRGLTVDHLVTRTEEKVNLHEISGAEVLDMESYYISEIATYQKIPILIVRVISDTVDENIPPLDQFLDPSGALLWSPMIQYYLSNPKNVLDLPEFARHTYHANKNLTVFFRVFVTMLTQTLSPEFY